MCASELTNDIGLAGYKGLKITKAKFVGITNGGDFCYAVSVKPENPKFNKVFVNLNSATGAITAGF